MASIANFLWLVVGVLLGSVILLVLGRSHGLRFGGIVCSRVFLLGQNVFDLWDISCSAV